MENTVKQSMIEFEQKLVSNNAGIRTELKKLLELVVQLPEGPRSDYSVQIAKMIYKQALEAYHQSDFFRLVDLQDCARTVFFDLSYIEETGMVFLQIMKGMLELKIQMGENENLEIYQEDLQEALVLCPMEEETGLEFMLCYANLQANCSMAGRNKNALPPTMSFVEKNIDSMEAISAYFPMNKSINLIYCRSLAATTFELHNHPNREMYKKCAGLLQNLVSTRKCDVPKPVADFLEWIGNGG